MPPNVVHFRYETFREETRMSVSAHVEQLRRKHAHLAAEVEEHQRHPGSDPLQIAALKKEKLRLKEEIGRLSEQ